MRLLLLMLGLSVGACSIPTETFIPLACTMAMCGENATCHEEGSAAVCVCDPGFQDHDNNNSCTPTCAEMTCGSKMSCQDSSGTAACVCNAGFQDNDGDGSCTFACSLTSCAAGGTCSDSSGTATCGCALGYQDNDGDKMCAPSCALADCTNSGCDDSSGEALCVCGLACGTNAACVVRNNVAACECTGTYVDFDKDGNCTAQCGSNLLNGTLTGGTATVTSLAVTGNYQNHSAYVGADCNGHRDASGALCDPAPYANSAKAIQDSSRAWSGPRWTSFNQTGGTGVMVIDAGSSITFNTLQLYQHFRYYGGLGNSRTSAVRYSVHASTTTAPSATDSGWVTLSTGFDAVPTAEEVDNVISKPGIWSGTNQTSRFIRVEVQGNQSYRAGFRGVKGFLCQ